MNQRLERLPNESKADYHKRLVFGKLVDKSLADVDYSELSYYLYGQNYHSDVARRMIYGSCKTLQLIDDDDKRIAIRILSLSDLHIPFQKPLDTFESYCGKVDILQLNGDLSDCQAISKFNKAYRISPIEELISTREYLIELIDLLKPKTVVVNYGNHDIRFQNYLSKNLDTDILELMPKTSLELIFEDGFHHYDKRYGSKTQMVPIKDIFPDVDIRYVDSWYSLIGDTIFCHPFAFSSQPMKTAEKAMEYFRNEGFAFKTLVMAHTHRIGQYKIGNTTLIEQGCCCDTKQLHYGDGGLVKSQKEGFVYLCQDADGHTIPELTKITYLN